MKKEGVEIEDNQRSGHKDTVDESKVCGVMT